MTPREFCKCQEIQIWVMSRMYIYIFNCISTHSTSIFSMCSGTRQTRKMVILVRHPQMLKVTMHLWKGLMFLLPCGCTRGLILENPAKSLPSSSSSNSRLIFQSVVSENDRLTPASIKSNKSIDWIGLGNAGSGVRLKRVTRFIQTKVSAMKISLSGGGRLKKSG